MIRWRDMRLCYWHNLHRSTGEIKPLLNKPELNSQPFSLFFIGTKDVQRQGRALNHNAALQGELHQGCILKSNPHVVCCLALLCTHWNHSKQCFSMPHGPPMSLEVFWRSEEKHTTVGLVILHKVTMVILYVLYVLTTLYKATDMHWETKPFLTVWNIGIIMVYVSTGLFIHSFSQHKEAGIER